MLPLAFSPPRNSILSQIVYALYIRVYANAMAPIIAIYQA